MEGGVDVLEYLDKSIATFDADPPSSSYQAGYLDALKIARAELATILAEEIGECELCQKPLAIGQFVNQYEDVGTAHACCETPFELPSEPTPSPSDNGTVMPTFVLLGKPALLCELPYAVTLA